MRRLEREGLPVVATLVLSGLEAEFYQLSNLAEQIKALFSGVFGVRIDENKLEAACRRAQKLVRENYLLPERADELVRTLGRGAWSVRYAAEEEAYYGKTPQETLFALKHLWASRWKVEALLGRMPTLAPPELPTLVQQTGEEPVQDADASSAASKALGVSVDVWTCGGVIVHARSR